MKTAEDISKIFNDQRTQLGGPGYKDICQFIADEWNADVEEKDRNLAFYFSTTQKHAKKVLSLRKQLRKVRADLEHARKLCDYYSGQITSKECFEHTLLALIEAIAKGNK